ncbi:MAG: F0F1 ATP synthase subunit delta [Deltaproteobacteria bacterium]|nr:MAG: F0F1 ATP synthase subunit delta [Deltaproteobacteria bacterium]
MINRKIARRYAKALMNIGRQDGNYERYWEELKAFASLFQEKEGLWEVLINPAIGIPKRKAIITELGERLGLSPIVINFLHILVDKNRMRYLSDIISIYQQLVDEAAGRARVLLVTAYDLSKDKLQQLSQGLEGLVGKNVVMEVEKDPSLIGGVVAKIGGMVYDGSVKTQLERFREILTKE